jgi:ribosomal protein S18 acetylase RimI-like enzyme
MDEPSPRPLAWSDAPAIHALMARRWAVDDPRTQMHIGDSFWTLRGGSGDGMLAGAWVWPRPDGALDAFSCIHDSGLVDIIVAPDAAPRITHHVLDLAERYQREAGSAEVRVVVIDGDVEREQLLHERGYRPGDGGNARFWMRIGALTDAGPLPDGYAVTHVASDADIARRVFVETAAFGGTTPSADDWRRIMQLRSYRADLDLLVVAPDGTGASALTVYFDDSTRCGEFNAVGTVPAHRRRGLCRALIVEGLRRIQRLGARQAVVETLIANEPARALYASCGFEFAGLDHAWTTRL